MTPITMPAMAPPDSPFFVDSAAGRKVLPLVPIAGEKDSVVVAEAVVITPPDDVGRVGAP